ncbi:hypothetical protein GCM10010327_50610 [Streptomyces nitrosporeus]|nr:hypothetical protein GCM10010327_50610 [Streptomyces nitrosporeus]
MDMAAPSSMVPSILADSAPPVSFCATRSADIASVRATAPSLAFGAPWEEEGDGSPPGPPHAVTVASAAAIATRNPARPALPAVIEDPPLPCSSLSRQRGRAPRPDGRGARPVEKEATG